MCYEDSKAWLRVLWWMRRVMGFVKRLWHSCDFFVRVKMWSKELWIYLSSPDQLRTIDSLITPVSSEPCGLVRLQTECTDCWRGNVHKWNVQGLGNYLNEELETNSKALLVLETLELLKGLWVPMSILNKPIDVYTISPPAVCHTLCLIYTIVRFDDLNITLKRKSVEKENNEYGIIDLKLSSHWALVLLRSIYFLISNLSANRERYNLICYDR